MNKRIRKKQAKNTKVAPPITKGDVIQACETIIKYGEQIGSPSKYEADGRTTYRSFGIDVFRGHEVELKTTCSDLGEILKPIVNYKREEV